MCFRIGPIAASSPPCWSCSGNGSGCSTHVIRPATSGAARLDRGDHLRHRRRDPREVERTRALPDGATGLHERVRHVGRVVVLGDTAEGDLEPLAARRRLHRLRRRRGDPLVAAGAVHDERPEGDRRDAVVGPVDPGRPLVRELVDAVVRQRPRAARLRGGRRVVGGEDGGRARIDHAGDPVEASLHGLEHVDGADDVDARAERRVCAAERHLQRGEVDHARDPVVVEHPLERVEVGDVAVHELTRASSSGVITSAEPMSARRRGRSRRAPRRRRAASWIVQAPMQPSAPVTSVRSALIRGQTPAVSGTDSRV